MERRLTEVLSGQGGNYILPFFWQHGEEKELLCEGMQRIFESGIRAVCVESRPHPDFLGDTWWRDMDIIMEKARKLGMKVWVLDDAHFPSGYCNGMVTADSPYGKTYLTHYCIDAVGPLSGCGFMVRLDEGESLIGVTVGKRDRTESFRLTEVRDITERVAAGRVYVDIPDGTWCVTVIKTTRKGTGRKNYISTIDREAVRFFIDTVYEAHYAHYKEAFGQTFAGFFSDEPEIGNCLGEYGHDAHIGQPDMKLPWSNAVEAQLRSLWGTAFVTNLVSLWMNTDSSNINRTGLLRSQFMDRISRLYEENFCMQIGDWCREHGVEYIGHVIEDGGSHAHLGLGTGHFFRALWGQDMSGIDVVLQQIRPQLDDFPFYSIGGDGFYHGELFHYGLAKMGVSLAHLDEKKKGRTMCEVFGAYGWAEGLKMMKWLMDHMLVSGVNYYVPHAFTMKDFPDPDCPPHFYARGMNPQFPYFKYLMEYCNRVSHLIQGGRHVPCAALLYTAEQEWMGAYRPFEKDARVLTQNQIDFEVLPMEYLLSVRVTEGRLRWGNESVSVLIIPGSSCVARVFADWIDQAVLDGLTVIVTERMPLVLEADGSMAERWKDQTQAGPVLKMEYELAGYLRSLDCCEIRTKEVEKWLRYYHYEQEEGGFWLFFTESVTQGIETEIRFTKGKPEDACWYDPWKNTMQLCEWTDGGTLRLDLSPYEMKILYTGDVRGCRQVERDTELTARAAEMTELTNGWSLETKEAGGTVRVRQTFDPVLGDIGRPGYMPYFSGNMYYSTVFSAEAGWGCSLDLGEVFETASVRINGREAGVRIAPPYRFDMTGLLRNGSNTLEVEVVNTLANRQRDFMSMTLPMEPSGLVGPVIIKRVKRKGH